MDKDELLILLESLKSHFDFLAYLEKAPSSSEYTEAKMLEVEEMGKDINLAINILKKA